jgi:hypothetical protein
MTRRIGLTKAQADQVEWALGPMSDHWCTASGAHARDGSIHDDADLPNLETTKWKNPAAVLILSSFDEINEDLLYRLEVQLQHMADDDDTAASRGHAIAGANAAERIRRQSGH